METPFEKLESGQIIKIRHMNSYFFFHIMKKKDKKVKYSVVMIPDMKDASVAVTLKRIRSIEEWNGPRNIAHGGKVVDRFEVFNDIFRLGKKVNSIRINKLGN